MKNTGANPAPWWYWPEGVMGIPSDDFILDLVFPAVLGLAGYVMNKKTVKDYAVGAAISGIATFLHSFINYHSYAPWLPFSAARASANSNGNKAQYPGGLLIGEQAQSQSTASRDWQSQASIWQSGPSPYNPLLLV
jgi:hypothetical protein